MSGDPLGLLGGIAGATWPVALTMAVVRQCDGCIAYHAKAAARRGATAEEVAEALGVALLMDGGTASVYGPRAWDAYLEFAPAPPASAVA